jgi:hypothetical protein
MLFVVLALTILSLPLILARVASSNARNSRQRQLAPVRVRAQRHQTQQRHVR